MKQESLRRSLRRIAVAAALLCAAGVGLTATAHAQDAAPNPTVKAQAESDIALIRAAINADRVDILSTYLGLTDAEAKDFWPLYKSYRTDIAKVTDNQIKMFAEFLQKMDTMSDDDAKKLTESYVESKKKKLDVQKGYIGKFARILPGRKVARLYQLENKVDAELAYEASSETPLIPASAVK